MPNSEDTGVLTVEVAFAAADWQSLESLRVEPGSTALDVLQSSKLFSRIADVELNLGIWGRPVSNDTHVKDGDRVEVYRPLKIDPREMRRQLATVGKTMADRSSS